MYKFILLFAVLILSANTTALADQAAQDEQVITLKDGSQIKGHLVGIVDGVYTVKTPIIGDVHVAAGDVASINNGKLPVGAQPVNNTNYPTTPNQPGAVPPSAQQIDATQKQLMSNPESMATLQEMMQDPEIMKALQDPTLVQAVTSHNYQAVQSNPRIQELMNNPKMKALLQKLAAQQQQSNSSSE